VCVDAMYEISPQRRRGAEKGKIKHIRLGFLRTSAVSKL
jgi:hypothetical protein